MNPFYRMGLMAIVYPMSAVIFVVFLGCCAHAMAQAVTARWSA